MSMKSLRKVMKARKRRKEYERRRNIKANAGNPKVFTVSYGVNPRQASKQQMGGLVGRVKNFVRSMTHTQASGKGD